LSAFGCLTNDTGLAIGPLPTQGTLLCCLKDYRLRNDYESEYAKGYNVRQKSNFTTN